MSNSRAINVANAAVGLLNSGPVQAGFAQTFTARRDYVPRFNLKQFPDGVQVLVIPARLDASPMTRADVQELAAIDVVLWSKVSPDADQQIADCDPLMLTVEQIKQALEAPQALALADPPAGCGWQRTENSPIFYPSYLKVLNLFTSSTRFTYLVRRAR
jgi:hypothetical protein